MENNVATTNTATTKKTKTQLMEEINALKAEVAKLDKYKQYENMANEMYAIQQSFVNAGFTRDEAFTLLLHMLKTSGQTMRK